MNSSIYISSEKIEVIAYKQDRKISINDHISYPLNEGITIGGTIIDHIALTDAIKAIKEKNPKILSEPNLIIDGNAILSKRLLVPKLSKKQYDKLVRDDFIDTAENFEEVVCGYQIISSKDNADTALLTYGASKGTIEGYISVFQDAGVSLKSIRTGVQGLVKYVESQKKITEQGTIVVNIVDGMTMLSMIFVNGENVFTSRVRLYGEDRAQYVERITESLSGLMQFCRVQNFGNIEASYYIGLSEEDLSLAEAEVSMRTIDILKDINVKTPLASTTNFATLGAMLPSDSVDFIECMRQLEKLKKSEAPKPYWIIPGVVVVLTSLAIVAGLFLYNLDLNKNIIATTDYINSPAVVQKSAEIDAIIEESLQISRISSQLDAKLVEDSLKAEISNDILEIITTTNNENTNVILFDFDEQTGDIRVHGQSLTEVDCAYYVEGIKLNKQVKAVNYTGYSYESDGKFNFTIAITLTVKGE